MTVLPFPKKLPKDTKVVVTGAGGFIGQYLVAKLGALGYQLTALIDTKFAPESDIRSAELPDADWCFHLAALTDAQSADEWSMDAVNYTATLRLLEKYGERLIFASTCAVNYPGAPYADSKSKAERMVRVYGGRTVRLCNIFGPGGHGVIDRFARAAVLPIRGTGSQLRTYAHVNHAVVAFVRQMDQPRGNIYILPGMNITVKEIADSFYPGRPIEYLPRNELDIEKGVQVYP